MTYSLPDTGIPRAIGVALALHPVVIGVVLVQRLAVTGPYGSAGVSVVVGALVTAFFLRRLYLRRASIGEPVLPSSPS